MGPIARWLSNPNTGAIKFVPLTVGIGAGIATTAGLKHLLVEPDRADELAAEGIVTLDSRQASVYAMAAPFAVAAGIGLGIQRRTPTSGLTTASQVATAALLSTVAGAVINADSDKAGDYVTGIGSMAALTGVGILMGVRDEVKLPPVRMLGLGLFGLAIGAAIPFAVEGVRAVPGRIGNSFEHRERGAEPGAPARPAIPARPASIGEA